MIVFSQPTDGPLMTQFWSEGFGLHLNCAREGRCEKVCNKIFSGERFFLSESILVQNILNDFKVTFVKALPAWSSLYMNVEIVCNFPAGLIAC